MLVLEWNHQGFLPAVMPSKEGHSFNRSPYTISSVELVKRFGSSVERVKVLEGF